MHSVSQRWFEPRNVKWHVSSIFDACNRAPDDLHDVQEQRDQGRMKTTVFAAGGLAVGLAVLIAALVMFAEPKKGREPNYASVAMLCLTLVGGAGAAAYHVCGHNNQKRAERDKSIRSICEQNPGLRFAARTEIQGDCVGEVPWFISEEWSHLYGLMAGEYQNLQIATVECTHVVDPVLAVTDSQLMQSVSSVMNRKHQRLYLRAMDASVFEQPLENVPDLVIVPRKDPNRAYFKRALDDPRCELTKLHHLPRRLSTKYWMASSAPEDCMGLFETALPALLEERKWSIIQVVGGHCVIMTGQWPANRPATAPKTEAEITENLDFACAVYQEMQGCEVRAELALAGAVSGSTAAGDASGSSATEPPAGSSLPGKAIAPDVASTTATQAADAKVSSKRQPHSLFAKLCLFGIGLPLFLIGSLCIFGIRWDLHQGRTSHTWPQVDAKIVHSGMEVMTRERKGRQIRRMQPQVSYEYEVDGESFTGDRITYGLIKRTESEREIETVLAKYRKDGMVKVHYHPESPGTSVLESGSVNESEFLTFQWIMGAFSLTGLAMCVYGFMGKKRRPS